MSQRTERIDELLRQEIGEILGRDLADPRIGFVTVTRVRTTPDLSQARVWVSIIGPIETRAGTMAALGRAMPFVRHELGQRLRLRRIPALHLEQDRSIEEGTRVLAIIDAIAAGSEPETGSPGESLPTPVARLPHEGDAPAGDTPAGAPASSGQAETRRRPRRGGGPASPGHRATVPHERRRHPRDGRAK